MSPVSRVFTIYIFTLSECESEQSTDAGEMKNSTNGTRKGELHMGRQTDFLNLEYCSQLHGFRREQCGKFHGIKRRQVFFFAFAHYFQAKAEVQPNFTIVVSTTHTWRILKFR